MKADLGHLNGVAGSLGIRPPCRERATEEELALVRDWMRLRARAYIEQAEFEEKALRSEAREQSE